MNLNYKRQIDNLLILYESKLKIISNENDFKLNNSIVFLIHLFTQFIIFYFLLLHPIGIIFYIVASIWVILITSIFYFPESIFIKLERKLRNTKLCYGLSFFYKCDDFNLSTSFLDNLFICKTICITTIIFLRILFNY